MHLLKVRPDLSPTISVLTSQSELFSILRKIINEISVLEDSDPARLAKYTRCLFQTIAASNEELGGRLLDEACRMASEARGVSGP